MDKAIELLEMLKSRALLTPLDFHLALFFTRQSNLNDPLSQARISFLIAWLSIEVRAGNVCVDLTQLSQQAVEFRFGQEQANNIQLALGSPQIDDWLMLCEQTGENMVSDGSTLSPFVLINNRLYFQRMWQYETRVANYFNHHLLRYPYDKSFSALLTKLFPVTEQDINWQKIATACAMTQKVTIISGGPGTGKTTTVSKILAALISLHKKESSQPLRIIATAPTGKAAARLAESLSTAADRLPLPISSKKEIPTKAITLHRLLGARKGSNHYLYNKNNPLNVDILLIDEASMIDLPMMSHVIDALANDTRLILLGDKEQLSSVEAGAVFGDLCQQANKGYSDSQVNMIQALTGYSLEAKCSQISIADNICLLQKSYRFDGQSGIGVLANLIKNSQSKATMQLFDEAQYQDIHLHSMQNHHDYEQAIAFCSDQYRHFLEESMTQLDNIHHILSAFSRFRLLCALREGEFGVQGLNKIIEQNLHQTGAIKLKKYDIWYIGRPVMVLKNNFSLGLFNGDIGITLPAKDDKDKLKVYFLLSNGEIKGFSPLRVPEHETAYAMTIHKSQGSEFNHVAIMLPNEFSPLLTRSLLYTAITRAKSSVSLYSTRNILEKTIKSQINRQSGLANLLL